MSSEQLLLEKWRSLPPDKQQEAIDFVEFLKFKTTSTTQHEAELKSKPPLGERLRKIREEIVASGVSLLDWEGVEREKAERRGGYREDTAPAIRNWLQKVTGSISDEQAFLEVLEYGKSLRRADRPADEI